MKRIICDRCGMEFGNDVPNLRDGVQKVLDNPTNYKITKTDPRNFPFMDVEVDLCPSCIARFREWMNDTN